MMQRCLALMLALCLAGVIAADATIARAADQLRPAKGWEMRITPYLWATGLKGDVAVSPAMDPVSVDAKFTDVLDLLDVAIMVAFEAQNDRLTILADMQYLSLDIDEGTPGPLFGGVNVGSRLFIMAMMAGYAPVANETMRLDILGGFKFWDVSADASFRAGVLPGQSFKGGASWFDPTVGARAVFFLSDQFAARILGNVGGFGVGSDSSWEVMATVGYQLNDSVSLVAGYRHLEIDYDDDGFVWDVEFSGPIAGLSIKF